MKHLIGLFHQFLDRLTWAEVLAFAACGVLVVGGVDYLTRHEISMSLFYLGPVAVAAWYGSKSTAIIIAVFSCVSWYIVDVATGGQYAHAAIPVWNALIRLGYFLITGMLLTALRDALRSLQSMARTDGLTGLYSRRAFEDRLAHDLVSAQRRKSALSLAYVDLDNFKAVNDARGHAEGDRLLCLIGRALKESARESDTAARLGGDEFALVLPDTDERGAQQFISKFTRELEHTLESAHFAVTCSIGIVTFQESAISPEHALAAADELMYEVKRGGKGAVAFAVRG